MLIDMIGRRFNLYTVISRCSNNKFGQTVYLCQCDYGTTKEVTGFKLRAQSTKSCGCLRDKQRVKHKHTTAHWKSPTYASWEHMKQRCTNQRYSQYKDYGGRGITIDQRWLTFTNFLEDMGERPKNLTLERIDNEKGYTPANCKWATRKEQMNNTRRNKKPREVVGYAPSEIGFAKVTVINKQIIDVCKVVA